MEEDLHLGETPFFQLVEMPRFAGGSLEVLSGVRAASGPFETGLIETVETAWRKPLSALTCEEVATLVGQRMALEWLAGPVLDFVIRYPAADDGCYPGHMISAVLDAEAEFREHAPAPFDDWLGLPELWPPYLFRWSRSFQREMEEKLAAARAARGRKT